MEVSSIGGEKYTASRTLVSFLMSLTDKKVRIELQNDTLVAGILEKVDSGMNMYLLNARVWQQEHLQQPTQRQNEFPDDCKEFESYFVQGCRIRYIHMEPMMDPLKVTEDAVAKMLMGKQQGPRKIMKRKLVRNEEDRQIARAVKEERISKEMGQQILPDL